MITPMQHNRDLPVESPPHSNVSQNRFKGEPGFETSIEEMVADPFANSNRPPILEKPVKWNSKRAILIEDLRGVQHQGENRSFWSKMQSREQKTNDRSGVLVRVR